MSQDIVSDGVTEAPSRIQHGIRHLAKLEACKCTPWLEDTMGLFEDRGNGRAIPDTERDGI